MEVSSSCVVCGVRERDLWALLRRHFDAHSADGRRQRPQQRVQSRVEHALAPFLALDDLVASTSRTKSQTLCSALPACHRAPTRSAGSSLARRNPGSKSRATSSERTRWEARTSPLAPCQGARRSATASQPAATRPRRWPSRPSTSPRCPRSRNRGAAFRLPAPLPTIKHHGPTPSRPGQSRQ